MIPSSSFWSSSLLFTRPLTLLSYFLKTLLVSSLNVKSPILVSTARISFMIFLGSTPLPTIFVMASMSSVLKELIVSAIEEKVAFPVLAACSPKRLTKSPSYFKSLNIAKVSANFFTVVFILPLLDFMRSSVRLSLSFLSFARRCLMSRYFASVSSSSSSSLFWLSDTASMPLTTSSSYALACSLTSMESASMSRLFFFSPCLSAYSA